MRKIAFVLLLAAAPLSAANAQNMPLNQFLAKATVLEKKGPMALFSSDMGRLKKEIQNSAKQLRAERLAAKAAGRKQAFCPPEKGSSLNSSEILSHFRSIPPAQRERMRTKDAFRSLMARKFPCR
jgi:hypothetical protein